MYTVVNPTENQRLAAVAETIEDTFIYLKKQTVESVKFIYTYRFELTLTALATFFILFSIYVIFFAPPMPPCVDGYQQP